MLALTYLLFAVTFAALLFFVCRWAWRLGRARKGSKTRAALLCLLGFLVVSLPIFWNWIPTAIVFRHSCDKDAGFVALSSPEEWVAANRGRLVGLTRADLNKVSDSAQLDAATSRYKFFDGLLMRQHQSTKEHLFGIDLWRNEVQILDAHTGKQLARSIDYTLGSWQDVRIWLTRRSCFEPADSLLRSQEAFLEEMKRNIK